MSEPRFVFQVKSNLFNHDYGTYTNNYDANEKACNILSRHIRVYNKMLLTRIIQKYELSKNINPEDYKKMDELKTKYNHITKNINCPIERRMRLNTLLQPYFNIDIVINSIKIL
jgi:hypothetical protein